MPDLKARDIMATSIHAVSPDLAVIDLGNELVAQRISGAPVVERGRVVGIVSRSDIDAALSRERTRAAAAATFYYEPDAPEHVAAAGGFDPTSSALDRLRHMTVRDIMTAEVISVPADASIGRVADLMRSKRIHRVLVIEDGELLGLVSSLDVVGVVADAS